MSILNKFLLKEEKSFMEEIELLLIETISILNNKYALEYASLNIDINDDDISIKYDSWGIDMEIKLGVDTYNNELYLKDYISSDTTNFDKFYNPYKRDYFDIENLLLLFETFIKDWSKQRQDQ